MSMDEKGGLDELFSEGAFTAYYESPEVFKAGDSKGWRGVAWAVWQKLTTDAQRLLAQLREELAQRDAELVQARKGFPAMVEYVEEIAQLRQQLAALESQQAASVGGEREAQRDGSEFWVWLDELYGKEKVDLWMSIARSRDVLQFAWTAWQARAALSLAGGGALEWAVGRWYAEVAERPMVNVHRRALDETWRQVIRHLGGDPDALCGPSHDELMNAKPQDEVKP